MSDEGLSADAQQKQEPAPARQHTHWSIRTNMSDDLWPKWRDGGYVALRWPELGDLTGVSDEELERRILESYEGDERSKARRAKMLRDIPVGSRIVANQGKDSISGIGTVIGEYYFDPEDKGLPHKRKVRWDHVGLHYEDGAGLHSVLKHINADRFARLEALYTDPTSTQGGAVNKLREPSNVIVYGPPGTGKTYGVVERALKLMGELSSPEMTHAQQQARFNELRAQGRVTVLTFHQSYTYEDFIEGLRPTLDDDSDSGQLRYHLQNGAFKQACMRAAELAWRAQQQAQPEASKERVSFERLWDLLASELQGEAPIDGVVEPFMNNVKLLRNGETDPGIFMLSPRGNGVLWMRERADELRASKSNVRAVWERDDDNRLDEEYIPSLIKDYVAEGMGTGGGCHNHVVWLVYKRLRELDRFIAKKPTIKREVQEAPQRMDMDRLEDLFSRSELVTGLEKIDFKAAPACVLIIDEINRGNIAKIFGELITLIEPSKRLGAADGMLVTLPCSQELFGVPANLHIIGTMNTADRSIALMDVALRRRFTFEELMPAPETVTKNPTARAVLETLNARIEYLYDREHTIGHASFMKVGSLEELRDVILQQVLPLLQDYFYGDWEKIAMVLGSDGKAKDSILDAKTLDPKSLFNVANRPNQTSKVWSVNDDFKGGEGEELEPFFKRLIAKGT